MKISNDVLSVLSSAKVSGNAIVLVGQLARPLYERTNKVLEAAGAKWNRKAKAHLFDGDAADAIEQIILSGEITIPQDFDYYPTPAPIVARLIELADLEEDDDALEPEAGRGAISLELLKHVANVDCIELLPDNVKVLDTHGYRQVLCQDFLTVEPARLYDRIVMNPPFSKQADIHHVQHALRFLKPDGVLVSVVSAAVTYRDNKLTVNFRALIEERGGIIEPLPDGAFLKSGTAVKTAVVVIPGSDA